MNITDKPTRALGRRISLPISYFNTDSIFFSDECIKTDAVFAERIKLIKYKNGIRIKAFSFEERYCIDINYAELIGIRVFDADECDMPKPDRGGAASVIFGWAYGLASLHDTKLKIGGRIELYYKDKNAEHEIILYHSKQDIFDMFKYIRKHFKDLLL